MLVVRGSGVEGAGPNGPHILTVALEDYYHVGAFNRLIQRGQWYRFERRIERATERTLDLLDEYGVTATFFVLGWVADTLPELVKQVAERGHEVASKGYYHRNVRQLTPGEFRDDLARSREAIERAAGQRVRGYRVADQWFRPTDLWALDVLAEEGYEYDSSIGPVLRSYAAEPWRRFAHLHRHGDRTLWELPISTAEIFGMLIPIAGGNYFRQFPHWMVRRAVDHWTKTYTAPFVMYFHTWELDPDQPKIAAPWVSRVRQYRNLDRMPQYLRYYLGRYRFKSASTVLGLSAVPLRVEPALPRAARSSGAALRLAAPESEPGALPAARTPVSVVIPCYNEELILPYLANTLTSVREQFSQYDLTFIFVDDQSTDGTWVALNRIFSDQPGCRLVRHAHNRGVAAGILTGIQNATTDIVCSMDCDCTYDPHELAKMIPMLGDGVDMVTASPYHPEGAVRNVPDWRLALSKTLSRCYRVVLHQRLATYTSCFRVYRRSAMTGLTLRHEGFLGVAEMLGRLDLRGSKIAEYPATLEVRMLGRSKMKILRTIAGHIGLLARFAAMRMRSKA
ncbi:MAG TPA: XrtA system polysaccharide deacetylase [Gemmatimonadaceae bacterium]|jgi:polysaccharide deacetylase family protein (PEP-CTERM system associated)|nr:XrtA system polysaccharide deacetylase [Gemmatimonadaceae bacterium]